MMAAEAEGERVDASEVGDGEAMFVMMLLSASELLGMRSSDGVLKRMIAVGGSSPLCLVTLGFHVKEA